MNLTSFNKDVRTVLASFLRMLLAASLTTLMVGVGATAQTVSKSKPRTPVRQVSPLIGRLSYRWATQIYNIQALDFGEVNDEAARTEMGVIRDQLQEAADLDLCKKTLACLENDAALVRMVVKAADLVMKERNALSKAIFETQVKHNDSASNAEYNLQLTHMHDADPCIKAIKSVATLGVITSNDIARCDGP